MSKNRPKSKNKKSFLQKKEKPQTLTAGGEPSSKGKRATKTILPLDVSPEIIGNYRILQKLGVGGMGEVYEAEQTKPIKRRVALKIIKWGMDTKQVVARFESERQALALMNHPNIARVFDAGATEQGRPYFAMEYVKGIPINDYCDMNKLSTPQRLELFIQACEGIQHAHQKGIIHRDIKASNVLVTVQDDKPVPKIIDFGVAKATAQRLTERTVFTEMGQLIGTPEYMSPEQAEMTGLDIDTRTDVYSLGVLLYELLVGVLPFESDELRSGGFDEIRRKVREEEPPKPSTRLTTPGFDTKHATRNRRTDLPSLTRQLKGELDWITMKAMAKDRIRRYASASELAADIMRYLRHEPVIAGPPSAMYRLKKYVRRHRTAVAAVALVAVVLVIGITGTSIGLVKATQAEKKAREEAETAQQVSDFLVELFHISDPSEAKGNTITAREILDRGAERIETELSEQPLIQARLMDTMGMVYRNLGLYDAASSLLEQALNKRRQALGKDDLVVSRSLHSLGTLVYAKGDFSQAEKLFREALEIKRKFLGGEHLEVAEVLNDLAMTLKALGNLEDSEPLYRESLAIRRKELGNEHAHVAQSLNNLGMFLYRKGDYDEAEDLFREALEMNQMLLGVEHPEVSTNMNNLALVLRSKGSFEEAEEMFRQVLEMDRKFLGENHPYIAITLNNLGGLQVNKGAYEEAEQSFLEAISVFKKTFPENHWQIANANSLLGGCLSKLRRYSEAEKLLVESYSMINKQFGASHRRAIAALKRVIELYEAWGKSEKADEYRVLLKKED
jgi:serine/threonine protein kinase/tetratricopeptide (TPR) repeat protein